MIKLTRENNNQEILERGRYTFINPYKVLEVFICDGKTLVQLDNGTNFFVLESIEYVVEQINKVFNGGVR